MNATIEVRVGAIRPLTADIREIRLDPLAGALPGFSAGSHVQLHLPGGLRNAYSLVGDPLDASHYRIAVRLQAESRGGSRYLHERLRVGDRLRIGAPANLFASHSRARRHLMIAGGIGITPFLAYSHELTRRGADFELHYAYRGPAAAAYVDELGARLGARLHCYDGLARRLDPAALLRSQPLGTHVYACGPQRLLDALQAAAAELGWPASRLHREAFAAPRPGEPFAVELARSGRRIEVGASQSLLEALEAADVAVHSLCRGGACGRCRLRYLDGEVEHRDDCLAPEERADHLMPCVSRGRGAPLLLDL